MPDRWDQYAASPAGDDKWAQYVKPASPPARGMEKLGGAPPAGGISVPLPRGLQPDKEDFSGESYGSELPIPIKNFATDGLDQIGQGAVDIGSGNHKARGVSNVIRGASKIASPAIPSTAVAAPIAAIGGAIGGSVGSALGSGAANLMGASPDTQDAAGDVAGIAGGAYGANGAGKVFDAIKSLRTPHPDLTFQHAISVHPADTEFNSKVPTIRAGIQRGAQLTGSKVKNPQSAIDATEAAQHELIEALADHKTNARRAGLNMPVEQVKAAQRAAIPAGLEDSDPAEYHSLMEAIDNQFPNKTHLDVDDVFNQAKLNNSRLNAFYSGRESAQNAKLMTNSGDTGVLKAAGDAYRQWIGDNLGPIASDLNTQWGDLNGAKHYLQAKINPSIREQPVTPLEGVMEKAGVDLGGPNPVHGVIKSIGKKIIGRPSGIDALLRSSFENIAMAGAPPITPNLIPYRLEAPRDVSFVRGAPAQFGEQRLLGSPDIVTPPPADTSSVRGASAAPPMRVGFPQKALPPATTMPRGARTLGSQHGDVLYDPLDLQQYVDLGR